MRYTFQALMAAGGLAFLLGCQQETSTPAPAKNLPAAAVTTLSVETKDYPVTEEVVGTVRAKRKATVEAKVSGRIQNLTLQAGDTVTAGTVIAELDVQEIQARLDQANAQLEQAQRDMKRMSTLLRQQAVTQQEYDATEARERIAKAAVSEARTMLGYAKITAPFTGVVTRKLTENGDLATPGKPLVEIEDPQSLRFEADVPETLLAQIKTGAAMTIQLPALNQQVTGTVTEVSPVADMASRTIRVKYDLPPSPDLRAGIFGRVSIPLAPARSLRVPSHSVIHHGQLEYVFVIKDGKAHLRLVKTGAISAGEVEIVSGLDNGESIVSQPSDKLTDGQPVTTHLDFPT